MGKELKKELFNIYDIVVFEDENGITQDCVCVIGKDKEVDEIVDMIECNNHSISIYGNGSYKVWEKDGKNKPYYETNKKIIHLYTLKNDNRFYEVYPTNEYEAIDNANPSEALECLEKLKGMEISSMPFSDEYGTQEVDLNDIRKVGSQLNTDFREYTATIKQALLKAEKYIKRLDAIDNTFEDCAICEIQKEFAKYDKLCEESKCEECALCVGNDICLRKTFERKWKLQKEIVSPNSLNLLMQELDCKDFSELRKYARCGYEKINKKYLKWEDLEFDNNAEVKKYLKVKLGENIYSAFYYYSFFMDCEMFCIARDTLSLYITDKQFFNDLHLERVKE